MSASLPISVIVPAYQAEARLGAALASVRAQTVAPSEIIVIDDGSSDRTGEIARALGATVHTQPNLGVAAARNAGIRLASQPWIALLDADDRWLPGKLAAQWEALRSSGDGLCATDFVYVHSDGTRSAPAVETNRGYRKVRELAVAPGVVHLARETLARALPTGMFVLPSTLLFERRIVVERDEWFTERTALRSTRFYHLAEDLEWLLRVLRWSDVVLVKRVFVEYLIVAGSLSSNAGRMRYGDAKLAELVCASPARYAEGAAPEMHALRGTRLREAALQFTHRLEFDAAAVAAREAYLGGRRPLDGVLWAFARAMNSGAALALARAARFSWRRGLKPALALRRRSAR
jgi:glycosyltransferase involved in cell wall biosynthesis